MLTHSRPTRDYYPPTTRSNLALAGSGVSGERPLPAAQQLHSLQPHAMARDLTQAYTTACMDLRVGLLPHLQSIGLRGLTSYRVYVGKVCELVFCISRRTVNLF